MIERRATPRQRVFKAGTIEFDGVGIDCIVRNLSHMGAALDVPRTACIPHEVTLAIATRNERYHCYIVWRGEKRIGVTFD